MPDKRKRCSYDARFKLKVIQAAEATSNRWAAGKFDISEKTIRDWRKKKSELEALPMTMKARRGPMQGALPVLEELRCWIEGQKKMAMTVSRGQICMKARSIAEKMGDSSFKASAGWCTRFLKRHGRVIKPQQHETKEMDVNASAMDLQ